MTISNRRLDRYRLGELEPEEARDVLRELEAQGELHRLEELEADAEAFLEHYPPGPAVQHLRADLRRAAREPEPGPARSWSTGGILAFAALAVAMFAFMFFPAQGSDQAASVDVESAEPPFIRWADEDLDCVGVVNCRAAALQAYKDGRELLDNAGADLANPYLAYRHFDRAELLLDRGGSGIPDEMADLMDRKTRAKVVVDHRFKESRVKFGAYEQRKMYRKMATELIKIQATFPDERNLYHQWAVEKVRKMKEHHVYPRVDSQR